MSDEPKPEAHRVTPQSKSLAAEQGDLVRECLESANRCVKIFWRSNIQSLLSGAFVGAVITWGIMR